MQRYQKYKLHTLKELLGEVIDCLESMDDETYEVAQDGDIDRFDDIQNWQQWIAYRIQD